MSTEPVHITVCICTFRRPTLLRKLLEHLDRQESGGRFTFDIVVTDNDGGHSAQDVVASFAASSKVAAIYCSEPRQNIALARNAALKHATGAYAAFIDDDEFPEPGWLAAMLAACETYRAAGVLGPVRPHFEESPPDWIITGRFCERPEHPTGTVMDWEECRTGNVLLRRHMLQGSN